MQRQNTNQQPENIFNEQCPSELQVFNHSQTLRNDNEITPQQDRKEYRTSINQLISQPYTQNYYSVQYVFSSMYQLSSYLFNKKIQQYNTTEKHSQDIDFGDYLDGMQDEFTKYDKFKKARAKQNSQYNQEESTSSSKSNIPIPKKIINNQTNLALESQLVRCYQNVPFVYFEEPFSLNFSNFGEEGKDIKFNNVQKMTQQQQWMNETLDLIEINLFGQIHRKFEDYFKAATNFDYLHDSIRQQLKKIIQCRKRIKIVQMDFVESSQTLRKKIIQRNNYQKLLKKIKVIKSLQKLPSIIQSILQSSLPYQCLQLLQTTKNATSQIQNVDCMQAIVKNVKSCQTIVQLGLSKRYNDQIYLYVSSPFTEINFQAIWEKISSEIIALEDNMNGSTLNNLSRRSNQHDSSKPGNNSGVFILDELNEGTPEHNSKTYLKNNYAKRHEGKQYEIVMIILQSYQYVSFPTDVTKIKISNSIRSFCKKFEKDLEEHLKKNIKQLSQSNHNNSSVLNSSVNNRSFSQQRQQKITQNSSNGQVNKDLAQEGNQQTIESLVDKITVEYYIKHLQVLNDAFKQVVNRYLGYVHTLIIQYEERISKDLLQLNSNKKKSSLKKIQNQDLQLENKKSQSDTPNLKSVTSNTSQKNDKDHKLNKIERNHEKFKHLLDEQMQVLPSIFKIIEEKIKYFLTLKNLSRASPNQFMSWVSIIRFWQKWFDLTIQENCLLNYTSICFSSNSDLNITVQTSSQGSQMMDQLINIVLQKIQKSINCMSTKSLIAEVTVNYLNQYSMNITAEVTGALQEESWQSVQIPQQFSDIVKGIISKPSDNPNLSITILNSSAQNRSFNNLSKISATDYSEPCSFNFKILKNNILADGQRYRLTVSFLLLCQFIEEYTRIGRSYLGLFGDNDQSRLGKQSKKIQGFIYQKIYQLAQLFAKQSKQMILEKKALKFQKIKGNNITVKHLCLLSNCLSFLEKIIQQTPAKDLQELVDKKQKKQEVIYTLTNLNHLLADKISGILTKKVQSFVGKVLKDEGKSQAQLSLVVQSNQSILTVFLQITQIIDEYLDVQKCQMILRSPFQIFVQKYFKSVVLKGQKFQQQMCITLQKLKFLKKYFRKQLDAMQLQLS